MKKLVVFALLAATVALIVGCTQQKQEEEEEEVVTPGMQIPNPFTDEDSLQDVQEKAGFELELPENFNGCVSYHYRAMANKMIEIICQDGNGNEIARIRKAVGNDSISGDYNEYSEILEIGSLKIKGNDGTCSVAEWVKDGYSYSITVEEPVSLRQMKGLVELIK